MSNGNPFHFAAILWRGNTPIRVGINDRGTSVRMAFRKPAGEGGSVMVYRVHAETDALRAARPGDVLQIIRWHADGTNGACAPCPGCLQAIRRAGISKIYYRDQYGNLIRERLSG